MFGLGHFQGSIIRLSGAAETCFLLEEKKNVYRQRPPVSFCDKMCVLESIFLLSSYYKRRVKTEVLYKKIEVLFSSHFLIITLS